MLTPFFLARVNLMGKQPMESGLTLGQEKEEAQNEFMG